MRLLLLFSAFLTAIIGVGTPASAISSPAHEISAPAATGGMQRVRRVIPIACVNARIVKSVTPPAIACTSAPLRHVPIYAERLRI